MYTIDEEIEVALISGILQDADVFITASLSLVPEDFSLLECETIYRAAVKLFKKGVKIDALTVLNEIDGDRQEFKAWMVAAIQSCVSTANHKEQVRMIAEKSKLRQAEKKCLDLLENLRYSGDLEICRTSASDVLKAFDGLNKQDSISAYDGYMRFLESADKEKHYIKTGFSIVDKYVRMSPGDFVGIGGRPSTGKTAFSLQVMMNIARQHKTVYFSLETSTDKLFERMVSCYASFDYDTITKGKIDYETLTKLNNDCHDGFSKMNFSVVNAAGWTVEQIRSKALQMKAEVIFVDYLGLIRSKDGKSIYEKVTQISLDLHTVAQQDKVLIVTLIQLNRGGAGQPDMTSLRDSGQIEQDLDVLMLLHTPDESDAKRAYKKLTIAKNKDGKQGIVEFEFKGNIQRFISIDTEH